MGSLNVPSGGLTYLDANCVVYHIERIAPYVSLLAPVFQAAESRAIRLVTSELTLLECLVKPVRARDAELERLFRSVLLDSAELALIAISRAVLESAVRLRADQGLKTPDAIHAASALAVGCAAFYTNDSDFRSVAGLRTQVLRDALD